MDQKSQLISYLAEKSTSNRWMFLHHPFGMDVRCLFWMDGWMDIHERACHWLGGWLSLLHKTYLAQIRMNGKDQDVAVNLHKTFIQR
jgi:hypothetical protein